MRTLLITDVETTGLSPETDRVIEVAIVAYDVVLHTVIETYASLINERENAAEAINRISPEALHRAPSEDRVWRGVEDLVSRYAVQNEPLVFMAHRAEFDRSFYDPEIAKRLRWICSKHDLEWPLSKPGDSLVHVALAHGVPVHDNHRALTDTMLLVRSLQRCAELGYDVHAMLARAQIPKARYVALVSYEARDLAKSRGFAWDGARKEWHRRIIPSEVAALALPFDVRQEESAR